MTVASRAVMMKTMAAVKRYGVKLIGFVSEDPVVVLVHVAGAIVSTSAVVFVASPSLIVLVLVVPIIIMKNAIMVRSYTV